MFLVNEEVLHTADLLEVVHTLEQTHVCPNLSTGASAPNIMFIGITLSE